MLAALRFSGRAARVHEEERRVGVERNRLDDVIVIIVQDVFDEKIAAHDHRRFGTEMARVTLPDQNFVDRLAFFRGGIDRDVGAGFVIDPLAVAMVAVGINQNAAAGIGRAQSAGFAAESAEDDRVNHAEPRAREHRDRQLGNHRHVNRDAIAGFQSGEIAQHRGGFVHAAIQLLIGDDLRGFVLGFRHEDQRGFIFVLARDGDRRSCSRR